MTPSARIAADIRDRIATGALGPGDRVPSARQITQEWGVAIATATKVLAALRQEGLVTAVPGVGTVVAAPEPARARRREQPAGVAEPTRERITAAAIRIADSEGIGAVSMRRLATDLDLATMSLYRHVQNKDDLILLMIDAVFTEQPPPHGIGPGWRDRLEALSRLQWSVCRSHPWVGRVVSFTRPQLAPNAMVYTEWAMAAVDGLGLDPATMLYIVLTVTAFTLGTGANLEAELEAQQDTGITSEEWMAEQDPAFDALMASGRFPQLMRLAEVPGFDMDLDTLFEFGLQRVLDGLAVYIDGGNRAAPAGV